MYLRIITVYYTYKVDGYKTAYAQQLRYMTKGYNERGHVYDLLEYLSAATNKRNSDGDSMIIMWDLKEDIRSQYIRDKILDMVGVENAPRTYHRGSNSTDTIMCVLRQC